MTKHSKDAGLLKILSQKTPSLPVPAVAKNHSASAASASKAPAHRKARPGHSASEASTAIRGKAIQFYLHEEDEKLIRELSVWLAPHRKRINDSLVIKSVLRAAKTGPKLLEGYDSAVKIDGRRKHRKKGTAETP